MCVMEQTTQVVNLGTVFGSTWLQFAKYCNPRIFLKYVFRILMVLLKSGLTSLSQFGLGYYELLVSAMPQRLLDYIMSECSHCFQKGNRNSGRRLCIMVRPSFWEDYYMLIYTHCWELMNSVGSHGSLSLLFVMKVMVCHFVSNSHEVMTALIVVLPIIIVVEISLQLHQAFPLLPEMCQKFRMCIFV